MTAPVEICEHCRIGYHAPFGRFSLVASFAGPQLLYRCTICGTDWLERLHDARMVTAAEAEELLARSDTVMATN